MGDSENWSSFEAEAPVPRRANASNQSENKPAPAAIKFNPRELQFRLIFGGLVGFSTGAVFGAIEELKTYNKRFGHSLGGVNAVARGAAVTGGFFAGYFCTYQGIKLAMKVQRGKEDICNAGTAMVLAGLPFIRSPVMRANVPYLLMLVVLDHFHEEINHTLRGP